MFQNWEFLIAEIWAHLLIAIALTLFLSWALWGMRARGERKELVTLQEDLQNVQRTLSTKESDLEQALNKQEQLKNRMSGFQSKLTEALVARKSAEQAASEERTKLTEAVEARDATQKELSQAREKLEMLRRENSALRTANEAGVSKDKGHPKNLSERLMDDARTASVWTKNSVLALLDKAKR